MIIKKIALFLLLVVTLACAAQVKTPKQSFVLRVNDPASQAYQVEMICSGFAEDQLVLVMPTWTPGYYQILNYAQYVYDFKATDDTGKALAWEKSADNKWRITKGKNTEVKITYSSKATKAFVANSLLDAEHGYIMPAGMFMHVQGYLKQSITLTINNYPKWSTIATGLEPRTKGGNIFSAPDFDTFYDSPILLGNLEQLPDFYVKGIPHYFIGYALGDFDKKQFTSSLQHIVEAAVDVIHDVPYQHYSFLAVGPVPGGIEHLNSTGFGFSSGDFAKRERLIRMYTFLSHEYFHHYNVKRIRPIELGPFDYDAGSKTTMLWIAEGFTNYYDELLVKRADLISKDEYLKYIENRIQSFENKPGRLFQTAADASFQTWADGPFGRTGDDAYKTISVYEKGSLIGLLLDLNIRQITQNKKSLDDIMRYLYQEYYQKKQRGFTEKEFEAAAEQIAQTSLSDFFEYVNTVREMNYGKYLLYAGLQLQETTRELPDPYVGLQTRVKNDTLLVTRVDWESPAWKAGLRSGDAIVSVNGNPVATYAAALKTNQSLTITLVKSANKREVVLQPVKKSERHFMLTEISNPAILQKEMLKDWLREKE